MLAGLALVEVLADAEDDLESGTEGELRLLDELGVGLAVVLTALGVAEDGILAAGGYEHVGRDFAGVGALGVVRAVLGGQANDGTLHDLGDGAEVGVRSGDDQFDFCRDLSGPCDDCLGKLDAFRNGGVHFPVSCYNVLSHSDAIKVCCFP